MAYIALLALSDHLTRITITANTGTKLMARLTRGIVWTELAKITLIWGRRRYLKSHQERNKHGRSQYHKGQGVDKYFIKSLSCIPWWPIIHHKPKNNASAIAVFEVPEESGWNVKNRWGEDVWGPGDGIKTISENEVKIIRPACGKHPGTYGDVCDF